LKKQTQPTDINSRTKPGRPNGFSPKLETLKRIEKALEANADHLSAKEVCDIIIACKGANISSLKCNNLELQFHGDLTLQDQVGRVVEEIPYVSPAAPNLEPEDLPSAEGIKQDLMETQANQMLIDDPAEYEKMMMEEQDPAFSRNQ
jgi:hypothetical protein